MTKTDRQGDPIQGSMTMRYLDRLTSSLPHVVLGLAFLIAAPACGKALVVDGGDEPKSFNGDVGFLMDPETQVCEPGTIESCGYGGPLETLEVGICIASTRVCLDDGSGWSECGGEILPQIEDCSTEVDDDCDGLVNEDCGCVEGETIACYSGPFGTAGVGICAVGVQICENGVFGPCVGEVTPQVESCDTPDDEDCDGSSACNSGPKRGLTWVKYADDSCGQTRVNCDDCDPYIGDTLCTEARPLLCLRVDGSTNCGDPWDFYDGWTEGTVALTPRLVLGTELTSLEAANAICENEVGPGFRMAEHHDGGGGWGWRAKGNINPPATPSSDFPRFGNPNSPNRFWVHINDQPGNCWD